MKVFAIFAFIQIVGILGNPIVLECDKLPNKEIGKVQVLQRFFNSFSVLHLNGYPASWIRQGKIKCRLNGGISAENSAVGGMETYLDSLIELTSDTRVHLETASHKPHGSLAPAVKTACNWFTRWHTLMNNLMHSLKPCWSTQESTSAELMGSIASAVLEYACENEGSRVSTFFTADGDVCLSSSTQGIQSCYDTSFSSDTRLFENVDHPCPMTSPWEVPIIGLNTQICSEFETFQQCVVGVLERCPNSTPSSEINSLFNIVKITSGCESINTNSDENLIITDYQ